MSIKQKKDKSHYMLLLFKENREKKEKKNSITMCYIYVWFSNEIDFLFPPNRQCNSSEEPTGATPLRNILLDQFLQ